MILTKEGEMQMEEYNLYGDYSKVYDSLGIEEDKLPDLSFYYERAHNIQSSLYISSWGTPERFINALYWMKFVKKYDWYEISETLGKNHIAVRQLYHAYGWHNDIHELEVCEGQSKELIHTIEQLISQVDNELEVFKTEDYLEKEREIPDTELPSKGSKKFHVATHRELFRILYYLVVYKELSPRDVCFYYQFSLSSFRNYLVKYNIGLSPKEARARIEKNGRGNHGRARITLNKKVIKRALTSGVSNNYELLFRDLITSYVPSYFDIYLYEVIIGIQTNSISPPQEIDIPIIIISKQTDEIFKYAIELSGRVWHAKYQKRIRSDVKKNSSIEGTDWKMITINFGKMTSTPSKVKNVFVAITRDICEILLGDIHNPGCAWKTKTIEVET